MKNNKGIFDDEDLEKEIEELTKREKKWENYKCEFPDGISNYRFCPICKSRGFIGDCHCVKDLEIKRAELKENQRLAKEVGGVIKEIEHDDFIMEVDKFRKLKSCLFGGGK